MKMTDMLKEKLDRWATAINALISIPIIGYILKNVFGKVSEKGAEKLGKKIEEALGLGTKDASKKIGDEILYNLALYSPDNGLTEDQVSEVDEFEGELRSKDSEKAEAYVLFVAHKLEKLKRPIKKVHTPKKGEPGPKEEAAYDDYEKGFKTVGTFLKELLKHRGDTNEETFEKRVAFLQSKNVFSLISEKKSSPIAEWLKNFVKDAPEKVEVFVKEAANSLDAGAEKLAREIEKEIYACDADEVVLIDPKTGKEVLRQKFVYKGFLKSGLPKSRFFQWGYLLLVVGTVIMLICGFIWS